MKQELFDPQAFAELSSRIIYTPSTFTRTSLLHLQEAGSFQAVYPHTSKRSDRVSCLCFVVLSGTGELKYEGEVYKLSAGDCVFIDCRKAYSHSTGYLYDENLVGRSLLDRGASVRDRTEAEDVYLGQCRE